MNILLVEDETRIADFVIRGLNAEGWSVQHAPDGESALARMQDERFDAVILDVLLPGMTGREVCKIMRARKNFTPVLMLTALDALDERVAGLMGGADDYMAKPFAFEELIARVQALVRRSKEFKLDAGTDVLACGVLTLDTSSMVFKVAGADVEMTAREQAILRLLLANAGKLLSRERIINAVWGATADPLTNVVDVYVARLRKKLGLAGEMIRTVRGLGYRLLETDGSDSTGDGGGDGESAAEPQA
ncbi:MAG: response regulator transcription factor [Defluviicoccus sp.]